MAVREYPIDLLFVSVVNVCIVSKINLTGCDEVLCVFGISIERGWLCVVSFFVSHGGGSVGGYSWCGFSFGCSN